MVEHAKNEKRRRLLQSRAEMNARLAKIKAKEDKAKQRFERGEPPVKRAVRLVLLFFAPCLLLTCSSENRER